VHVTSVTIQGYRSIRNLTLPIEACSVFVGANGVGKTNLYRALARLRCAANGTITRAIAEDGGIGSVLWAGPRHMKESARLLLKARFGDPTPGGEITHAYEIQVGLREPFEAAFRIEPLVKKERLTVRQGKRDVAMMERKGQLVTLRNEDGVRENHKHAVLPSETALAAFRDGARYPELEAVRRAFLDWRLYHDFRTDAQSPIRRPCHAITTPTLSHDGHDLAAVLATLFVIREDTVELANAIDDAFPGARLSASDEGSGCVFSLKYPDMPRAFGPHELSDGTLKYLCLLGALMGYRLPSLIAVNEPEASLHPSLLGPLARLVARSAQDTRIWIVTHSDFLAEALQKEMRKPVRRVVKLDGVTSIEGLTVSGEFRDDDDVVW